MSKLPKAFSDLEETWSKWILVGEAAQVRQRLTIPKPELIAFYDDMQSRIDPIIEYLDQYSVEDKLPEQAENLWWLLASYIGVALSLEMYGEPSKIPGLDLVGISTFANDVGAPALLR